MQEILFRRFWEKEKGNINKPTSNEKSEKEKGNVNKPTSNEKSEKEKESKSAGNINKFQKVGTANARYIHIVRKRKKGNLLMLCAE